MFCEVIMGFIFFIIRIVNPDKCVLVFRFNSEICSCRTRLRQGNYFLCRMSGSFYFMFEYVVVFVEFSDVVFKRAKINKIGKKPINLQFIKY